MHGSDTEGLWPSDNHVAQIEERTTRIRALNDAFRRTGQGGRLYVTPGIQNLGLVPVATLFQLVARYDAFSEDNDPYAEHDFGSLKFQGQTIFWKIDYYDTTLSAGSPDPSDPSVTTRVLTILLAQEY
jgi:hypothetical protein